MANPKNIISLQATAPRPVEEANTVQAVEVDENRPRQKSRRNPKDLVGLLLGYGARTRRATAPRTRVAMEVFTPEGKHAVKISFGA